MMRCCRNRDDRKKRDEGRSGAYEAEERDAASARLRRNPRGTGHCGRLAVYPKGTSYGRCTAGEWNDHSLRRTPSHPSRIAPSHMQNLLK